MSIDHLSASSVKKYAECPKQYYLKYIQKYELPEEEDNKWILLGSDIHEAIETTLKENPDCRDSEKLHRLINKHDKERYPSSMNKQAKSCKETAAKYIEGYVGTDVRTIEERWTMDYKGIELVGYSDLVENGHIIDWKTGKSEGKELDEKIQASFYIKLFENEFGELPEQVDFAYLDGGTRSTHKRITDDGMVMWNDIHNKYWEDTEKIINQILQSDANNNWPAEPERDKCHWCSYKLHCADSKVGSENVKREHIEL